LIKREKLEEIYFGDFEKNRPSRSDVL
jgi:hypothetical protein